MNVKTPAPTGDGDAVVKSLKRTLRMEAEAIQRAAEDLSPAFLEAVRHISTMKGRLVCSGIGKAGHVAAKVAATFSSLGTSSFFVHPADAAHGDLGMFTGQDAALLFSNSGESIEVNALIPSLKAMGAFVIALTGRAESTLARGSHLALVYGRVEEACRLGLAPTTSTTLLLALGDALAVAVMEQKPAFREAEYAFFHPGGALGKKLLKVHEVMRTPPEAVLVSPDQSVRGVLLSITQARAGAALAVDGSGHLLGIFADGDLRRSLMADSAVLEHPVGDHMTRSPRTTHPDAFAFEALKQLRDHRIGDLPVVDAMGRAVGMLSLKDLVAIGLSA